MVIRNTYNVPIQIQIVDQVPIALESDIEVSLENISNAEHILKTGRLTWDLTIPPIQNKKLTVAFFIKFPRNKRLIISPFYRHTVCATYI